MFGFGSSWKESAESGERVDWLRAEGFVSPIQKMIEAAPAPEAFHRDYPSAVEDEELDKWWRENVIGRSNYTHGIRNLVYVTRDHPRALIESRPTPYMFPAGIISPLPSEYYPDLSSFFPNGSGIDSKTLLLLAGAACLLMMKR